MAIGTLLVVLGYLTGRMTTVHLELPDTPITFKEDQRPIVPVLDIEGIIDGKLQGSMKGEIRFFLGDQQVLPNASGTFAVPADETLLTNVLSIAVPSNAKFVASRKGTKYYPVASKGGERIVLKNRVYFETSEQAEEAGYKR